MAPPGPIGDPVAFMISEGVRPGGVVTLFGDGMMGNVKVRVAETGTVLDPIQQDPQGRYVRVLFPQIAPGAYTLQVSANGGAVWSPNPSHPVFINRADARWLSDTRLYSGLRLRLMGRNLDAREYGGNTRAEIRLVRVDTHQVAEAAVSAGSPYCAEFTAPADLNVGAEYFIEIRAGSAGRGSDWVRLRDYPDYTETKLRAVPKPSDPLALELGVSWAGEFQWDNVKNVRAAFQAKGDGLADDTEAIQKAIDEAAGQGGGVVFIPEGSYRYRTLALDRGVVVRGESHTKSVLVKFQGGACIATKNRGSSDGLVGLVNLKMVQEAGQHPEYAFLLGYSESIWDGNYDGAKLTAKNLFIYNCIIDYTENGTHYDHGTWGLVANVKGPLLFKKIKFQSG